ncbi:DUF397 domain-containing protein [Streptomyces sp. NPDC020707]|uniref:DUF397 domain-containing protein n=1 Tax=Streptomyces TaxID=1883 RepID=UPI0028D51A8B|nr:DUF397 domain-containing protein [Streptomyces sp. DSM 40484]
MSRPPTAVQLAISVWYKSSYSTAHNECVEIARAWPWVGIHDSTEPNRGSLAVQAAAFTVFIDGLKT